ncbi:MAG: NADH-quinone oxidoreductase subunit M [Desulfuromonas sp.]|nr:MAG: NADH-quinone oxidoreductase subunit M [Desulfuromonas sp.]
MDTAVVTYPGFPWLTLLLVLPLLGSLICWLHRKQPEECRWYALAATLAVFVLSVWMFVTAPESGQRWFLYEDFAWIDRFGVRFTLGLDGLSLLMIVLTAFLQVIGVIISWPVKKHAPLFFILLMVMESGIFGVFLALDLVLFYIFWEVMLIPMFLLIGIWGGKRRVYASVKFFLYTLAGSLLMLLGILALYWIHGQQTGEYTFALSALRQTDLTETASFWLYGSFLIAFIIKVPLFPFHTWLPDAHTEAPTAGSLDLAGLLLKTGAYALIRFGFTLFPEMAKKSLPLLAALALIGLFHAAWVAYLQKDAKRLIAYSSISHLGLVIIGFAAWNVTALEGSILLMVAHGIATGGLFVLIAMLEARTSTRNLDELGGLWHCAPVLSAFLLVFALASLGLPGLGNFSGEILVLIGTFKVQPLWAVLAIIGVVFSAAYMLRLLRHTIWGPQGKLAVCHDLTAREYLVLVPMAVVLIWIGLYPATFLDPLQQSVAYLLNEPVVAQLAGGAQ